MNIRKLLALASIAPALCATQAHAASTYTADFSSLGQLETDNSFSTSFASMASDALLTFQLAGYKTLDGQQFYMDVFTLQVNGSDVFSGTFDLGGSGADRIFLSPAGSAVDRVGARLLDIRVPITLLAGSNTLTFGYTSPSLFDGVVHAGFQGGWDEGWGINAVSVTAVPEPSTFALLLAGLAAVGTVARRRLRAH